MIQAYEEPMVFTKNQTLNPVLVLSSKISLLFQLIHVKVNDKHNLPLTQFCISQELYRSKIDTFHRRQMIKVK